MNALVRQLFRDLEHARRITKVPDAVRGEVCEDLARRAKLVFFALDSAATRFGFEAIGAPELLAAAEWLCRDAERGGSWPARVNMDVLSAELEVSPAGRSGLLLVEDAAISLAGRLAAP